MTPLSQHWTLSPDIHFLNHGSFGACPIPVQKRQQELRDDLERDPVRFLARDLESHLDQARGALGAFVGATPDGLAFVSNVTAGINAVLRSLQFSPGDQLVTTSHEYNASRNVLEFVAHLWGAEVVVAEIPFPIASEDQVVDAIASCLTPRTKLLLVDHVTSQTALVLPIARIVAAMESLGIEVLVDGAHAPGMVPLDLEALGAQYYAANLHKWVCAPKGSGFLYVREDRREKIRPTSISHGANSPRTDRSRYLVEFDWTGTGDPTPWLAVPEALRFVGSLADGWDGVRQANHALALAARDVLCSALDISNPAPDEMIGSMVSVPLPAGTQSPAPPLYIDPLQQKLLSDFSIEVPVFPFPGEPARVLRASAQLYNSADQYELLASALGELLR